MNQAEIVEAIYAARSAFLQNNPTGYLRKIRLGRAELAQVQLTAPTNLSSGIGMLNGVPIERVDADSFIEVIYERF